MLLCICCGICLDCSSCCCGICLGCSGCCGIRHSCCRLVGCFLLCLLDRLLGISCGCSIRLLLCICCGIFLGSCCGIGLPLCMCCGIFLGCSYHFTHIRCCLSLRLIHQLLHSLLGSLIGDISGSCYGCTSVRHGGITMSLHLLQCLHGGIFVCDTIQWHTWILLGCHIGHLRCSNLDCFLSCSMIGNGRIQVGLQIFQLLLSHVSVDDVALGYRSILLVCVICHLHCCSNHCRTGLGMIRLGPCKMLLGCIQYLHRPVHLCSSGCNNGLGGCGLLLVLQGLGQDWVQVLGSGLGSGWATLM